jgi:hypothetical protein
MATLLQVRSDVKFMCGNRNGIDSQIDDNINMAIREFALTVKPQELWLSTTFTTVDATAEYTFSSMSTPVTDLMAILFVRDNTKDIPVKRGGLADYLNQKLDATKSGNTGDPNRWTRFGNALVLYNKIPDSTSRTMRMLYLQRPAALSGDTDTFPLNAEWEQPVKLLAAAYTWLDLNNVEKSNLKIAAYDRFIGTIDSPEQLEDESPESNMVFVSNQVR